MWYTHTRAQPWANRMFGVYLALNEIFEMTWECCVCSLHLQHNARTMPLMALGVLCCTLCAFPPSAHTNPTVSAICSDSNESRNSANTNNNWQILIKPWQCMQCTFVDGGSVRFNWLHSVPTHRFVNGFASFCARPYIWYLIWLDVWQIDGRKIPWHLTKSV